MKIVKCNVLSVECHRALDAALTMRCPNNMQHDTSKVQRLPRKMTMELSKALRLPQKMQTHCLKTMQSIAPVTQNDCRHACRHVRTSGSTMPTTQNDITTCLETFEKESFCSFLHRHGESRQDMLEPQNERFVRNAALQFSHFVASESTFS